MGRISHTRSSLIATIRKRRLKFFGKDSVEKVLATGRIQEKKAHFRQLTKYTNSLRNAVGNIDNIVLVVLTAIVQPFTDCETLSVTRCPLTREARFRTVLSNITQFKQLWRRLKSFFLEGNEFVFQFSLSQSCFKIVYITATIIHNVIVHTAVQTQSQ